MKKLHLAAAALVLTTQFSLPVHAEYKDHDGKDRFERRMEKREDRSEKMLERLTEKLKLSADQQAAIKKVFEDRDAKVDSLQKEFGDKRKAIFDETQTQITAVLTPAQKTDYEKMKTAMHERREKGMPHDKGDRKPEKK